jgi:hypothetical protein
MLSAGEPAPYGKGMDTVHDEAVRRAIQLAPDRVSPSPAWTEALSSITRAAANDLGIDPVSMPAGLTQDGSEARTHKTSHVLPGWACAGGQALLGTWVSQFIW